MIEAFPEGDLFSFTAAPPMRSFGELAWELQGLTEYCLKGLSTDDWSWQPPQEPDPKDRLALLSAWDAQTPRLAQALPDADPMWFTRKQDMPWGHLSPLDTVLYAIDNENHHRGQGYVYLRALGIEPRPSTSVEAARCMPSGPVQLLLEPGGCGRVSAHATPGQGQPGLPERRLAAVFRKQVWVVWRTSGIRMHPDPALALLPASCHRAC
ncbi:DinB family protein [Deinococcus malanensis]|uniref:DinB family protein n=1 Tax=Deinococcus malanensis TaxID=1706855 RepID=UPI0036327A94